MTTSIRKLAAPSELSAESLALYQKYRMDEHREYFRGELVRIFGGHASAFSLLCSQLRRDGLIGFEEFASPFEFSRFVERYDDIVRGTASSLLGHSFVDLKRHRTIFGDRGIRDVFSHPLLLAIVSYALGGPIRLVDIRGKDAEPAVSSMRDNGVHLDDSPYGEEFKVHVSWRRGTTIGPRGQNLVAIPGSHRLLRVRSTEHGANLKQPLEIINEILDSPTLRPDPPFVVEMKGRHPVTVVFEASALAHQRFRTLRGDSRSCVILAFHADTFVNTPASHLSIEDGDSSLDAFVLGGTMRNADPGAKSRYFLEALTQQKDRLFSKMTEVETRGNLIPTASLRMDVPETFEWLIDLGMTPSVEETKPRLNDSEFASKAFAERLLIVSDFDRHVDLDLSLYPDRRELIRKQLRNRIRETPIEKFIQRPITRRRFDGLVSSRLTVTLGAAPALAVDILSALPTVSRVSSGVEELRGIDQLVSDICDALIRSSAVQDIRSHLAFLHWTLDELLEGIRGVASLKADLEKMNLLASRVLACYADWVFQDDSRYSRRFRSRDVVSDMIRDRLRTVAAFISLFE